MAVLTTRSDFRAQEEKIYHASIFSPSISHEVMKPDAIILVLLIFSFIFLKPIYGLP